MPESGHSTSLCKPLVPLSWALMDQAPPFLRFSLCPFISCFSGLTSAPTSPRLSRLGFLHQKRPPLTIHIAAWLPPSHYIKQIKWHLFKSPPDSPVKSQPPLPMCNVTFVGPRWLLKVQPHSHRHVRQQEGTKVCLSWGTPPPSKDIFPLLPTA